MDPSANIIIKTLQAGYTYPEPTVDGDWPSTHKRKQALKDITLEINTGDFIVIKGLTGSGKTTLLYLLAGVMDPSTGYVAIDNIGDWHERQDTWNHGEIGELANPIIYYDLHGVEQAGKEMMTNAVGLAINNETFLKARARITKDYFEELTESLIWGAEQYGHPVIMFGDEPTNTQFEIFQQLHQRGITCIITTHDQQQTQYADMVLTLDKGKITCVE